MLLISPTYQSNIPQYEGLPLDPSDVFTPDDPEAIEKIIDLVEKEREEYDSYWEKMDVWKQMRKAMKEIKWQEDIMKLDPELLLKAYEFQCLDEQPPQHKYGGKKPIIHVLVDDGQSTSLMGSRKFLNFITRHRHIGARNGDRLGVSLYIMCQNYKAAQGGLPKVVRENATVLLLFKTQNFEVIKGIGQEIADDVPFSEFLRVYGHAINGNDHGFLTIDYNCKTHRFRSGFDEYIESYYDPGQPGANTLCLDDKGLNGDVLAKAGAATQPAGKPGKGKPKPDKPQPAPK